MRRLAVERLEATGERARERQRRKDGENLDNGLLDHDIDDPVRHDDHPAARLIIHRPHDGVEGERLALDPLLVSFPLDRSSPRFLPLTCTT